MRGDRCADFLVRRRGGVIFGFGKIGSSGVGDASVLVGIDGGKGAELEAVDVGKDGGAARIHRAKTARWGREWLSHKRKKKGHGAGRAPGNI